VLNCSVNIFISFQIFINKWHGLFGPITVEYRDYDCLYLISILEYLNIDSVIIATERSGNVVIFGIPRTMGQPVI